MGLTFSGRGPAGIARVNMFKVLISFAHTYLCDAEKRGTTIIS